MVKIRIETDRGSWVAALVAAGYEVFAINPLSVARYRERHSTSGAKSDAADAHLLAEIVRLDRAHYRPVAGDTDQAEAIKLTARTHQSLIWDRTRHVLRLRSTLREYFPVALHAFPDLDAPEALELLGRAPDPDRAARVEPRGHHRRTATRAAPPRRGPGPAAADHPGRPRAAAAAGAAGRLRGGRRERGRDHRRPEHPDRPARGGGGRPFWPTPGR
jgi:hypothetical protein